MELSDDPAWMGNTEKATSRCNGHSAEIRTVAEVPPLRPPPFEPPSPALTEDVAPAEMFSAQQVAERFGKAAPSIYMASIINAVMVGLGDAEVMRHYLAGLTIESHAQHDPLRRVLLEQITMASHRIASLQCNSANAKTHEAAIAYSSAATKLLGELRKCLLAMREMQAISLTDSTFKKISRTQEQPVPQDKAQRVTELTGNDNTTASGGNQNGKLQSTDTPDKERKTSFGRPPQSEEMPRGNRSRAAEAACSDLDKPALAALNGTAHARW